MQEDGPIEATFCFIDIAGYTALTNTHGEIAAGDLHIDQQNYWFCSLECIERFAREPAVYLSHS